MDYELFLIENFDEDNKGFFLKKDLSFRWVWYEGGRSIVERETYPRENSHGAIYAYDENYIKTMYEKHCKKI